jgi:hypothetical protein
MADAHWKSMAAATTIALCCVASDVRAQSASSFQNSCSNISVTAATLKASCRRVNGTYGATSIAIRGIENIDGTLKMTGTGASSYQRTCRNIGIVGDVLSATCKKIDGSSQLSSLEIPGIANIDGVLTYQ